MRIDFRALIEDVETNWVPIERFNGPNADIHPSQHTVTVAGVRKWKRKILAGDLSPVRVGHSPWHGDLRIKDGHHRLKAYEILKYDKVPVSWE